MGRKRYAGADRRPAWMHAVIEVTRKQQRAIESWEKADAAREQIADVLASCALDKTTRTQDDAGRWREAVEAVQVADAGVVEVEGKPLRPDWLADPARAAEAMIRCSVKYGVGWNATLSRWSEYPLGCGQAICPLCARRRAANRAAKWAPVFRALSMQGYPVIMLTGSQPVNTPAELRDALAAAAAGAAADDQAQAEARGDVYSAWLQEHPKWAGEAIVMSDEEAQTLAYDGPRAPRGPSTPGESLRGAMGRLQDAFALLRYGASRSWFTSSVLGGVVGYEVTARREDKDADGNITGSVLRWHAHFHGVFVLYPGADLPIAEETTDNGRKIARLRDDGGWYGAWLRRWQEVSGGAPAGQDGQLLRAGDDFEEAAVEALKYPAKISSMTRAQVVDWLACMKGAHLSGLRYGGLHASSRIGRVASWAATAGRERVAERLGVLALAAEWAGDDAAPQLDDAGVDLAALRILELDEGRGHRAALAYAALGGAERRAARALAVALTYRPERDLLVSAWRQEQAGEAISSASIPHPVRAEEGLRLRPLLRRDLRRTVRPVLDDPRPPLDLSEVYLAAPDGWRLVSGFNPAAALKDTEKPPLSEDERQILIQRGMPDAENVPGQLLAPGGVWLSAGGASDGSGVLRLGDDDDSHEDLAHIPF